jgi:hypothetical protein
MSGRRLLMLIIAGLIAVPAAAQDAPPLPRAENREFRLGGALTGPSSMGSSSAVLFGPTGAPAVTLFNTENRAALGFGLETALGFRLTPSLWAEVAGSWTRVSLSSRISSDFEGAAAETISAPVQRFTLEGAAVWYFRSTGPSAWFLRTTGGWMREGAGGLTLARGGTITGAGLGVRRWWRAGAKPNAKRVGIRAEFRGLLQTGGLTLGSRSWRFGPAGAVTLVVGY